MYVVFYLLSFDKYVCCSREDLLRIPEISINPLGDRIVDAFFPINNEE